MATSWVMRSRALAAVLVALALGGCNNASSLAAIIPSSAAIVDVKTFELVVVGGFATGAGVVAIHDVDGQDWRVPVNVSAGNVGGIIDIGFLDADFQYDLGVADIVNADDLFGSFEGSHYAFELMLGGGAYDLQNERNVILHGGGLGLGFAIYAGHVWLGLEPSGPAQQLAGSAQAVDAGPDAG